MVRCSLPGGKLCSCEVPNLSAVDVRKAVAKALCVDLAVLSEFSLLFLDLDSQGDIEVWDESLPLPPSFFQPTSVRQCRRQKCFWPSLQMRRLRGPAHQGRERAHYVLGLLDSDQVLEDLRAGNYPGELMLSTSTPNGPSTAAAWLDVASLTLQLAVGARDPAVHSPSLIRRLLPQLLPSLLFDAMPPASRDGGVVSLGRWACCCCKSKSRLRRPRRDNCTGDDVEVDGDSEFGRLLGRHADVQTELARRNIDLDGTKAMASAHHFRGIWHGPLAECPGFTARIALLAAMCQALPTVEAVDIASAPAAHSSMCGRVGGNTLAVDLSAYWLFANVRLGDAHITLALGPVGVLLLLVSAHLRTAAKAAARELATAASAPASHSSSASSSSAAQEVRRLTDAGAAVVPWSLLGSWRLARGNDALDLVIPRSAVAWLRRRDGGEAAVKDACWEEVAVTGSAKARTGREPQAVLRLRTAQAPMIACVLRAFTTPLPLATPMDAASDVARTHAAGVALAEPARPTASTMASTELPAAVVLPAPLSKPSLPHDDVLGSTVPTDEVVARI